MTPKCNHGTEADERCARCYLRQKAYDQISEKDAETILGLLEHGVIERLKPPKDWEDVVEASADDLECEYDYPQNPSWQQALEIVDSSQWVNSRGFQMSTMIYGTWFAWFKHGGLLDQEDPYPDLARFALANAVLEVVEGRVSDRKAHE